MPTKHRVLPVSALAAAIDIISSDLSAVVVRVIPEGPWKEDVFLMLAASDGTGTAVPSGDPAADALGVRRFVPCGVHTGASLALETARQAGPDRAAGAVLSGVPLLTEEERATFLAEWAPPIGIDGEGSGLLSVHDHPVEARGLGIRRRSGGGFLL